MKSKEQVGGFYLVEAKDLNEAVKPRQAVRARATISYLNASGSRLSTRPSSVSACGYIRNGRGSPREPGSSTSCAKLYAIQFISHDPNSRVRAAVTIASVSGRFPGGSSSTTLRTSAGSTGTQPESWR